MIEGILVQEKVPVEDRMPYAPYPLYPSGLTDDGKAIYRYAHPQSDSPILILTDPIYDDEGNHISPGHYSLLLSAEKTFLFIVQSDNILARLPVFRIEEDKEQIKKEKTKKYKKAKKKKEKQRKEINAKLAKQGMPQEVNEIYTNATIEFHPKGQYYLIKYERDKIRAWGAIKKSKFY